MRNPKELAIAGLVALDAKELTGTNGGAGGIFPLPPWPKWLLDAVKKLQRGPLIPTHGPY